jgi:hypothetical protein
MSVTKLSVTCNLVTGPERPLPVEIDHAVIAGWTGRDPAAVQEHIVELQALGVAPPKTTPEFYRVSASRLTTASVIQSLGDASSGEAEALLIKHGGELFVGVGSDHTDRDLEAHSLRASKQICDKPVAAEAWLYADVHDHWDDLILRSFITEHGQRVSYQEGKVSVLRHPDELMEKYCGGPDGLADGSLMFCGTCPVIGGVRPSAHFEIELEDPILGRRLSHTYDVTALPDGS